MTAEPIRDHKRGIPVALLLSYLLHPVLIPLYATLFFLSENQFSHTALTSRLKWVIGITLAVNTFVIPLLLITLLLKTKVIRSFRMESREERIFPLTVIILFYFLSFYLLHNYQVLNFYSTFMLGCTILGVSMFIFNIFRKISLHMAGWGGILGVLLALSLKWGMILTGAIYGVIFLAGLAGYSRLKLHAHHPAEIYTGFGVGLFAQLVYYYLI